MHEDDDDPLDDDEAEDEAEEEKAEEASVPPPDVEEDDEEEEAAADAPERRRRRLERVLPQLLKRAIEKGLETGIGKLTNSREALKGVVGDNVKLPQEIVSYVFSQVDDTKNAMVRVVAREVRDFLAATDLSHELQKALTSLSFEIRTEIRFIPNESGGLRPEVKADVEPKHAKKKKKREADDED